MPAYRSFLFTPGNHARRVSKVFDAGADAAILDLEDAVAIAEKPATRGAIVEALQRPHACRGYVRVNAFDTEWCYRDLVEVVGPWLDGIVLPKVEAAWQLKAVDWLLGELERERELPRGGIDLLPIIETGRGIAEVHAIAAAGTRARRIAFGAGDYTNDMGMVWTRAESELQQARSEVAVASRAAGIDPPIDTVWVDLKDAEGLHASAVTAKGLGFQGKMCIHPDQIAPVNAVFGPSAAEIDWAGKVIAAFEAAEAQGLASIQLEGKFIDYPIVYRARRLLELAKSIAGS